MHSDPTNPVSTKYKDIRKKPIFTSPSQSPPIPIHSFPALLPLQLADPSTPIQSRKHNHKHNPCNQKKLGKERSRDKQRVSLPSSWPWPQRYRYGVAYYPNTYISMHTRYVRSPGEVRHVPVYQAGIKRQAMFSFSFSFLVCPQPQQHWVRGRTFFRSRKQLNKWKHSQYRLKGSHFGYCNCIRPKTNKNLFSSISTLVLCSLRPNPLADERRFRSLCTTMLFGEHSQVHDHYLYHDSHDKAILLDEYFTWDWCFKICCSS